MDQHLPLRIVLLERDLLAVMLDVSLRAINLSIARLPAVPKPW
jgi:hypothetical protein